MMQFLPPIHMMQHCIRVTTALAIASSTLLLHASLAGAEEPIAIAPTDQISAPMPSETFPANTADHRCDEAKKKNYITPGMTGTITRGNETTTYIARNNTWLPILRVTESRISMVRNETSYAYAGDLWEKPYVRETNSIYTNGTLTGDPLISYGKVQTYGQNPHPAGANTTEMIPAIICIESDVLSIIAE